MKGKIFVIDGVDSSGKESQTIKLYERLRGEKHNVIKVSFPNYDSKSSELVKMYLNGEFGSNPDDVDSYIASTFYALDRYASYKKEWGKLYENGTVILCDRYTTSNMVHQAAKIDDINEKDKFLEWLWQMEYKIYKLPIPDCVLFLDMPPQFAQKLMKERANKINGKNEKDIHERNKEYIEHSYNNALYVSKKYNWIKIDCIQDESIRSIEDIHNDIYRIVSSKL